MGTVLNRRAFLSLAGAAGIHAALPGKSFAQDIPSLYEIGAAKGIDIGSILGGGYSKPLNEIVRRHCSLVIPENALKPGNIAPSRNVRHYDVARTIYDFALDNGKKFHGHTLFWHHNPLTWASTGSFADVKADYGQYMRETIKQFPKTASWDVFNEIFEEKTRLRKHVLLDKYGLDFVEFCLKEAKSAAPDAAMVINDYTLDCAGDWCSQKRANVLWGIEELLRRGAPIDAVGIQGHLSSKWVPSPQKTLAFIKKVERLGLDVYISEMDVNDIQFSKSIERRDHQVAQYYYDFLSTILQSKAVKRVAFWGISDYHNWIVHGYAGPTIKGAKPRPALFDSNNEPKPAFYAVARALEGAPVRIQLISVKDAQQILNESGYDAGPADGAWGKRSLGALNKYRESSGLGPASSLDIENQKLLMGLRRK